MGLGLAVLNRVAGWPVVDRVGLRRPVERGVYQAARTGFRTVGATTRAFAAVSSRPGGAPVRLPAAADHGLFDLTPSDEQQMITAASAEFAAEVLRPAASDADTACQTPATTLTRSVRDLGVTIVGVPEALGGVSSERSATTNVLIAEALAHGDMGQAVAILAPAAVSGALVLWGDEQQQSTYLPAFVGDNSPAAALAVLEPTALFDPFVLSTAARRSGDGFLLTGLKSLVPRAAEAELFVVAARLSDGRPGLFLVESDAAGLSVEAEPAMGLRAASLGRLVLDEVRVPGTALLGAGALEVYRECIRLARLGWCALSLGTAQAVLDYVIPYVNDRVAFGEPVSHRQSVAFAVADIGIELEGMRLATYRAASRADQGHSFARESALARTLCASYGMKIGSNGVQLLGGHGFVKEHPVERWYRDLRAVGLMEGAILV
jgi:alkylation response protein AidB-like acyl-CoA dehydrogenase